MYDKATNDRVKNRVKEPQRGPRYEQAALLYARFTGVTEEPEYLRVRCKEDLDQVLDAMKPDEWNNAEQIVVDYGEPLFRDLVQYGLNRTSNREKNVYLDTKAVAVEQTLEEPEQEEDREQ